MWRKDAIPAGTTKRHICATRDGLVLVVDEVDFTLEGDWTAGADITTKLEASCAKLITLDATALATEAGNVLAVNMVLLGALIQTGIVPIDAEKVQETIRTKTKPAFVDLNLKAFELGFAAAAA